MRRTLLIAFFALASAAAPGNTSRQANPLGIYYDNSFTNIEEYSRPGALLVAGNCNRYDPRFAKARAQGAEVIAYFNVIEMYDRIPCKLNAEFYMDGKAPFWPYPKPGQRVNWPKTHMLDMRAGSPWSDHVVSFISDLMREGKVDGVFLDNIGARLWSQLADWKSWPDSEQDEWTRGNIDIVRRLDEKRREINPKFIIVTNNLWDRGDPKGFDGERYVDGVVIEHPKFDEYHERYAGRKFSDLGHRHVLLIARSPEDAVSWSKVPGVTHVTFQPKYDHPGEPLVPFTPIEPNSTR